MSLEEQISSHKLTSEAHQLVEQYFKAKSAITAKFLESAKAEFPQFDLKVILSGLTSNRVSTIHEALSDRALINLGVYTASALLDPRGSGNSRDYKSLSGEKIDTPILTDLFPWLKDGSKESNDILEVTKRFSDFRFHNFEEPNKQLVSQFRNIKSTLKKDNPGFPEVAYDRAIDSAWRG